MQILQNPSDRQLLTEHPLRAYYVGTNSVFRSRIESPALREYYLITLGKSLAHILAQTLDQLRAYNEEAIYPIVSILEPYMETTGLDLDMPPVSSGKVILNVTNRRSTEPDFYLE